MSESDTRDVPQSPNFVEGARYVRQELHDQFGGQRQYGISTPADYPVVFLFTSDAGDEYGYDDHFEDDHFVYSGEGRVGDMTMERGNEAIRDHREHGDELHLFEETDERGIVRYLGQFEYVDHFWERAEDVKGNVRDAVRFELESV